MLAHKKNIEYSIVTLKTQEFLTYQQVGYKFHYLVLKAHYLLNEGTMKNGLVF